MASKNLNMETMIWPLAALVLVGGFTACHESGKVDTSAPSMEQTRKGTGSGGRNEAKQATDVVIATKVKTALMRDPQASGFQISVNTYRGVVQLSGFVDTIYQKQRAGELAQGIEGVREVRNDLIVTSQTDFTSSDVPQTDLGGVIVRF